MKTSEVLENLKGAIAHAKEVGVEHVAIADLESFATELERQANESPEGISAGEASMEAYKAKLAALGNSLQQEHETNLEMLRTVITTGQSALKSSLLINGAAAAALLAFIGGLWGKRPFFPISPTACLCLCGVSFPRHARQAPPTFRRPDSAANSASTVRSLVRWLEV